MSSDRGDRLSLVGAAIALLWGCAKINRDSVLLLQRAIAQKEFWTFQNWQQRDRSQAKALQNSGRKILENRDIAIVL